VTCLFTTRENAASKFSEIHIRERHQDNLPQLSWFLNGEKEFPLAQSAANCSKNSAHGSG
jgi:hypothetical protein